MKIKILFLQLCLATLITVSAQTLDLETIFKDPIWIGSQPQNISWDITKSNQILFKWNPHYSKYDSMFSYNLNTMKIQKITFKEAQELEAQNDGNWNTQYHQAVYSYQNDIYLYDKISQKSTLIIKTTEVEQNPKFFKDGQFIYFLKNNNIYTYTLSNGVLRQLTNFSTYTTSSNQTTPSTQNLWLEHQQTMFDVLEKRKEDKKHEQHVALDEKNTDTLRSIFIGDKNIRFQTLNNTGEFLMYGLYTQPAKNQSTIVPNYVTETGYTANINARTKVGQHLGTYQLFCLNVNIQTIDTLKFENLEGIYDIPGFLKDYPVLYDKKNKAHQIRNFTIFGMHWNPAGNCVLIDIKATDNKDRWLIGYFPETKSWTLFNRQHDEAWIGGPGILSFGNQSVSWLNNDLFYFQSEVTGFSHLYTYHLKSKTTTALTSGKYEVQELALSKDKDFFIIKTNETHPGKQQLYKINVDGTHKQQLTKDVGLYELYLSPQSDYVAFRYSNQTTPWELYTLNLNSPNHDIVQITNKSQSPEFKKYKWQAGKIITIPARDGQPIYVRLYEPPQGKRNKAAVTFVHGAGYLQNVHFGWSSYFREFMFNNLLAQKGYTVIDIDYRGSSGYGRDWRTGIYRFMGGLDLDDQEDALLYLAKNYGIDAKKLGMYGGSYGGFITLMALFTKPDLIKAGGALRSVTDWAHYNHGYTANILNEPFTDSIAYYRSSPINFPKGLKNNLLMCHGMLDVNVHFQDIVRLSQRLIELEKNNWELAVYPLEDHGFVEPSSWLDEYKRIFKLFEKTLK
ncbi:MAG: prolyl oligopeptidase family serine peptidase [Alphaproteobacteria bacterium]|nr:prolyl oligopeptidase family serine peptidase [Alphaproteobacteria bacterium]